jgi:hypothetical protein
VRSAIDVEQSPDCRGPPFEQSGVVSESAFRILERATSLPST